MFKSSSKLNKSSQGASITILSYGKSWAESFKVKRGLTERIEEICHPSYAETS